MKNIINWAIEFLILIIVVFVFWSVNAYLAVSVLIFHGLCMIQIYKTQNLIGHVPVVNSIKQKVLSVFFVLILLLSVIVELIKNGIPAREKMAILETSAVVELANGEFLPYLILLCLLSALLTLGLATERRRR